MQRAQLQVKHSPVEHILSVTKISQVPFIYQVLAEAVRSPGEQDPALQPPRCGCRRHVTPVSSGYPRRLLPAAEREGERSKSHRKAPRMEEEGSRSVNGTSWGEKGDE